MSDQPHHRTGPDGATAEPPPESMQGYPPEADPEPDVVTPPVEVPGEQTSPTRRLDVFPEDGGT